MSTFHVFIDFLIAVLLLSGWAYVYFLELKIKASTKLTIIIVSCCGFIAGFSMMEFIKALFV